MGAPSAALARPRIDPVVSWAASTCVHTRATTKSADEIPRHTVHELVDLSTFIQSRLHQDADELSSKDSADDPRVVALALL
jgi:hypothetical protein